MSVAGTEDYDVLAVQYTYAPVDPYPDVAWLLGGEGSWTGYSDDTLNEALTKSQLTSDPEETKELFSVVDKKGTGRCPDVLRICDQRTGGSQQADYRRSSQRIRLLQRCPELGRSGIKKNPVSQNSILPQWDLCGAFLSEKKKFSSDKSLYFIYFML